VLVTRLDVQDTDSIAKAVEAGIGSITGHPLTPAPSRAPSRDTHFLARHHGTPTFSALPRGTDA
jgi:hypothetical protein